MKIFFFVFISRRKDYIIVDTRWYKHSTPKIINIILSDLRLNIINPFPTNTRNIKLNNVALQLTRNSVKAILTIVLTTKNGNSIYVKL